MRWTDISGGIRIWMNIEEVKLFKLIRDNRDNNIKIYDSKLDERNKEIARLMVSRGILNIDTDGDLIYYQIKELDEVK